MKHKRLVQLTAPMSKKERANIRARPLVILFLEIFFTALMASFVYGCSVGFTESTTSTFLSSASPFEATKNDISWMASIHGTGTLISVILCYTLTNKISLKTFVLGSTLTFTTSWLLILTTSSIKVIIACFFFYGVAASILVITAHIYFAEISTPDTRAFLILLYFLFTSLGIQIEYAMAAFENYRLLAAFPLAVGLITLMLSFFMVESPYYLVSKGREEEAADNVRWLRDKKLDDDLSDELAELKKHVDEQRSINVSDFKAIFISGNLKILSVILLISCPGTVSVSSILYSYGPDLIKDLESFVDGRTFIHIFGTLRTVCQVFSMVTVTRFNRFSLIFYGMIGGALIQIACALCFYVEREHNYQLAFVAYSIAFLLLLYFLVEWLTVSAGIIVLRSEVFPHRLKEFYVSVLALKSDWLGFSVSRSYFWLSESLGTHYLILFYSSFSVAGAVLAYFTIKNTKGKSLNEIRNDYGSTSTETHHQG